MTPPDPINCDEALARMLDYVNRELHPHEREAMEQHLHTCQSCFSRAEFERRLKQKLQELRGKAEPAARKRLEKLIKSL